jgi:tetratricopeptide (TPR) repeat protein
MWRSYYLFWLAVPAVLAAVSAHPSILLVFVVALLARRWLPDPYLFLKHANRVNALKNELHLNPANAHVQVQLAEIWLAKRRPRRAIPLLEHALERDPESAELRYLLGLAQLRAGLAEAAIGPLTEAVTREPKLRYGHAWLALADALFAVGRMQDAIDAYQRALKINTSSLETYAKLARALEKKPDLDAAARVRLEALDTYRVLPRYQRRMQLGWWLCAKLAL